MTTPFPFSAGAVLTAANLNSISELPTRTLAASGAAVNADRYSRVILNGTSITYTVNSATFDVGEVVQIYNANSTAATIAAGTGGVTINGAAGLTLAQWQSATLYCITATSFILFKSDVTQTAGKINQVQSVTKNDTFTTTSTSFVDITGLSVNITPSSASSNVLVFCNVNTSTSTTNDAFVRLVRGSTAINIGTGATTNNVTFYLYNTSNVQILNWAGSFLDSPATTSSTTYKLQMRAGSDTVNLNRRHIDTVNITTSSVTVLEVLP